MTTPSKSKVFRITFKSGSHTQILDIEDSHIGLAIGHALKDLQERHYTYKIEDCSHAELISEFLRFESS